MYYSVIQERVVQRLQALKGQWPAVSRESGVPYGTLRKIAEGTAKNPRAKTVETLDRYLEQRKSLQ